MKALIVHNSDEVKDVFIGTPDQILEKVKKSQYNEEIRERLLNDNQITDIEPEIEEVDGVEVESDFLPTEYNLSMVLSLSHDGDSVDGFSMIDVI